MSKENAQERVTRDVIFFLLAAVIGSIVYFGLTLVTSSPLYPILVAVSVAAVFFGWLVYRGLVRTTRILGIRTVYEKFSTAPSTLELLSGASSKVEFFGISGRTFFESEDIEEIIKQKIREGVDFEFLLLNPASSYVKTKAEEEGDDASAWAHDISASMIRLERIKGVLVTTKLQVRQYDAFPVWRGIFVDHRIALVSFYPAGHQGKFAPVMFLENNMGGAHAPLYSAFYRTYKYLWDNAKA